MMRNSKLQAIPAILLLAAMLAVSLGGASPGGTVPVAATKGAAGVTAGLATLNRGGVAYGLGGTTADSAPAWDINHDGKVDYKDLAILSADYGDTTAQPPYPAWDINQDGKVDYKDLAILGAHYGDECVPPVISALAVSCIAERSTTVTWTTSEPATSQVEYGTTAAYGSTSPFASALETEHSVILTGLAPDTLYHCRVKSGDASGNQAVSADATFQTTALTPYTVDHRHTRLGNVPLDWINRAKADLHIAYGHTSHGSQITTGMSGLVSFANAPYGGSTYTWNSGGTGGALDLRDSPFSGALDLGNPNRTAWAAATREYLDANPEVNVIVWSWCGQVSSATAADIDTYLTLMSGLETDYPDVRFVYMTGHTDGTGLSGNLQARNQQIRDYCSANHKVLYDFEDIESYDPDGKYFGDKDVADDCSYSGGNWAIEWQDSHTMGVDWYTCDSAHSEPLNANLKAYAAWWLWATLAGWDGSTP